MSEGMVARIANDRTDPFNWDSPPYCFSCNTPASDRPLHLCTDGEERCDRCADHCERCGLWFPSWLDAVTGGICSDCDGELRELAEAAGLMGEIAA